MKVRRVQEWEIADLNLRLKRAYSKSPKTVAQVCREAGISTSFWYEVVKGGESSISYETLEKLCKALGFSLKVADNKKVSMSRWLSWAVKLGENADCDIEAGIGCGEQ